MVGCVAVATTLRLSEVRVFLPDVGVFDPLAGAVAFGAGLVDEEPLPSDTLSQSAHTRTRSPLTLEEIEMDFRLVFFRPQATLRGCASAAAVEAASVNATAAASEERAKRFGVNWSIAEAYLQSQNEESSYSQSSCRWPVGDELLENEKTQPNRLGFSLVAGAGFEPTTSGL